MLSASLSAPLRLAALITALSFVSGVVFWYGARVARKNRPLQGTIKSRLLSMSYTTPEDFASDVRLVFTNAIGFNPESHFVHTWAVQLLSEFDVSVAPVLSIECLEWARRRHARRLPRLRPHRRKWFLSRGAG